LLSDDAEIDRMCTASRQRFQEAFTWENVLEQYERLLREWAAR
jgi:glycosyltransferase involved in cell wall biosynthesis